MPKSSKKSPRRPPGGSDPAPDKKARGTSKKLKDLNQKVERELHHAIKVTAVRHDKTMKELLEEAFRCWVQIHGDQEDKLLLPA